MREYEPGLHEVADGCHAYLQPGGGWGWSNAGLVVGDGGSLLVDTLFDLDLTARMLEAMAPAVLTAPIGTVVNTHANGDHCYGNQLLGGTEIVASTRGGGGDGGRAAGAPRRAGGAPRARSATSSARSSASSASRASS